MKKGTLIIFGVLLIITALLTAGGCSQLITEAPPSTPQPEPTTSTPPPEATTSTPPPEATTSTPPSEATTTTPTPESTPKTPPSGNSISGHVYDDQDGAPIKNALIRVEQRGEIPPPVAPGTPGEPVPLLPLINPAKDEARTAADGSYIISCLPSGIYKIMVTADRRNSIRKINIRVTDNSSTVADFTLYKLSSISGHVYRADDGKPLAGARIEVWPAPLVPYMANTAADGNYTVTGFREGEWTVRAGATGYVPKTYDGATGTYIFSDQVKVVTRYGTDTPKIDFILERGGSISGQIFEPDSITPATGAWVEYVQTGGTPNPGLWQGDAPSPYPPQVETDSSGRYIIAERLTGTYKLRAVRYTDGQTSHQAEVSVVIGQHTKQDFILGK